MTGSLRLMLPVTLAIALAAVTVWTQIRDADHTVAEVERVTLVKMNRLLTRMQGSLELALSRGDDKWVRDEVAELGADPSVELAVLLDDEDRVVTSTRLAQRGREAVEVIPGFGDAALQERIAVGRDMLTAGEQATADGAAFIGIYPVSFDPAGSTKTPRVGILYVRTDLTAAKEAARSGVRHRILRTGIVLAGLFLALGVFLHFRITRRIRRIALATKRLAKGDLEQRSRVSGGDEIGTLGEAFDRMAKQREDAERVLREREARHRMILDTAADAILVIDDDETITAFNHSAEQMTGYEHEEAIGEELSTLLGDEVAQRIMVQEGRGSFDAEVRRKDGSRLPVSVSVGEPSDGAIRGRTAVIHDLTSRHRLEAQFLQSQKMEAVGRLASGVAHDFNNLLMGVVGCSELAMRRIGKESGASIYLDEIRNSAATGASITRQLLAHGRREGAKISTIEVDVELRAADRMLRRLLGEEFELTLELGATGVMVRVGEGQLDQIVMNLVVNARDAMPRGGRIRVETSVEEVSSGHAAERGDAEPQPHAVVSVSDTGCGMDAETLDRIFEPFFSTKDESRGTGLGLSTVYGIVKASGGQIMVHSEVGVGTTFKIVLPQAAADDRPDTTVEEPGGGRAGHETVLVVEDDRLVRMAVVDHLRRWGYRVLEASDFDGAVRRAADHAGEVALLVTDMVLPGGGGREVAGRVTALSPEAAVIFMSAHPAEILWREGRLNEGTQTLQKPFTEAQLMDRVRQVLGEGEGPRPPEAAEPGSPPPAATSAEPPVAAATSSASSSGTILLVEDDRIARMTLEEILGDEGHTVLGAGTVTEALELGTKHADELRLVITDVNLPDGQGPRLVATLRERVPDLCVMFVTGQSREEVAVDEGEATVVLEKPVDLDRVLDTVERMLDARAVE